MPHVRICAGGDGKPSSLPQRAPVKSARCNRCEFETLKGVAIPNGPESCVGSGNCLGEALTGERAGRVLSREIKIQIGVPTLLR